MASCDKRMFLDCTNVHAIMLDRVLDHASAMAAAGHGACGRLYMARGRAILLCSPTGCRASCRPDLRAARELENREKSTPRHFTFVAILPSMMKTQDICS